MADSALTNRLVQCVGAGAVAQNAPLASLTTFGVGGPADWLVTIRNAGELPPVLDATAEAGVPLTILGGGSNVVIADAGLRGVVLRLLLTRISQPEADTVRAEAGVTVNGLVRWTIGRGLAGLEAWAGTPGSVGGAIFGNAHYGGRNIGDLVVSVRLSTRAGVVSDVAGRDLGFAYDTSRLKETGEILIAADFRVRPAPPEILRATARQSLAHRKGTQPLAFPSAGCMFQNPDPSRDAIPAGMPPSAGALIDRAGLKGHRMGGVMISPVHANFFVTDGTARAEDIRALAELARSRVKERFGVELRDEIMFLGFPTDSN